MKTTVTAHRLSLQYDSPLPGPASAAAFTRMLDEFTAALQQAFPEHQPQITTDSEDFDPETDLTTDDGKPTDE